MFGKTQMYIKPIKALGQNFLKSEAIARAEAAHAYGKNVLELGAGYGILTKELIKHANRVVSVEKDINLCRILSTEIKSKKFKLVKKDFFKASKEDLEADKI